MNINNDRKSNNNEYDDNDSNNNDDDCIFSFRTDNIKIISDVLQCLSSTQCPNGICIIEATPSSLIIFTSNKSKSLEARITWNSILFDDYICNHDSIKLCINLNILIDCLLLFGNTSDTILASFSYSSNESIFKLSLEESGIITTCDITCLYNDNDNDLYELECGLFVSFRNAEIESQIIVQSEHLKDAILELIEVNGANQVKITIQNNPKTMKMLSKGAVGTCEIEFPRSSDVFVKFDCFNNATWSYPLASLALGMKALGVAKETYIRINANGVACVQHQIETTKEFEVYVDFIIAALETDIE
jgi:hypothetical protein